MSEWKKVKIGDICKIVKGTTGIASTEPGQYPLVVTAEERKTCSTYQFDCEAVCIPLVSSSGHGKKSLKNVHYQSGKFALGTILCAVIPNNPQELDARYLHQYLQFYKDIILVSLMKGAANVSLSMKDIATVEFPLPPIKRQRELSNLFVSLQEKQKELSAEYEKQTEYAKLLRQNILQQAIEGKLTADWRKQNPVQKGNPDYDAEALFEQIQKGEVSPSLQPASQFSATPSPRGKAPKTPENSREFFEEKLDSERKRTNNARSKSLAPITDEEKPFGIPEGWKWVRLDDIGVYKKGPFGSALRKDMFVPKSPTAIKVYEQRNAIQKDATLGRYYISEAYFNKLKSFEIFPGDIIVSCAGTIGETFIIPDNIEKGIINQALMKMRITNKINCQFFLIYFDFILKKSAQEKSKGTAIKNIPPFALFKNFLFALPSLKEQEEIVNKVETLLAKLTTLENQIQDRKSLSDKLIFGIMKENLEG